MSVLRFGLGHCEVCSEHIHATSHFFTIICCNSFCYFIWKENATFHSVNEKLRKFRQVFTCHQAPTTISDHVRFRYIRGKNSASFTLPVINNESQMSQHRVNMALEFTCGNMLMKM